MHHELVASARATAAARELAPGAQVGCMILAMPTYPLTPDPADVLRRHADRAGELRVR